MPCEGVEVVKKIKSHIKSHMAEIATSKRGLKWYEKSLNFEPGIDAKTRLEK